MAGHLSEKAIRYVAQLDAARCDGRWGDVPELARKVEKHAPERKCLALTARTEAQLATQGPATTDPTKSTVTALIPPLRTASGGQDVLPEDAFEAAVCLAWIHWLCGEYQLAVARLPDDFAIVLKGFLEGARTIGQWVRVCAVRGAYIKGHSLEKLQAITPAAQTYLSMLPYLSSFESFKTVNPQFCLWTQCLLTRLCVLSASPNAPDTGIDINTTLWMFRIWHTFWMTSTAPKHPSGFDPLSELGYLWRDVWFAYYTKLSEILQHGWLYAPGHTMDTPPRILESPETLSNAEFLASRLRQRADLKSIEAINESFLLKETQFPKAIDRNEDVEAWAAAVMRNWRIMCGPSWRDEELGEGGKGAVARGVLDILYRAATKTFHSTQILRFLFTVHASLAEFDLAFKAFDSYTEIITRGKDRAEKSGEVDSSMDDDDTMLRTSAEAIRLLCRFGDRAEAEKAKELSEKIEKWLKQHTPAAPTSKPSQNGAETRTEAAVSPKAIAIAYGAVGMANAQWARLTYDAKARAGLQAHAVDCYRQALSPKHEFQNSTETRYALALLLAEMRDISDAIKVVKQALGPVSSSLPSLAPEGLISDTEKAEEKQGLLQERKSVQLWHLLGLLLTARSDYEIAGRVCDAAFEQFGDPSNIFGGEPEQYRSEHLNSASNGINEKSNRRPTSIIHAMEHFEKESLLQVKVTQLSLIEALHGSNAAVDACAQLLALYAHLYGDPSTQAITLQPATAAMSPPKTSHSIRDSILGRSRGSKRMSFRPKSSAGPSGGSILSRPSTMATTAAAAPTIHVIDEDDEGSVPNGSMRSNKQTHHFISRSREHSPRPSSRRSESVKLKKRSHVPLEIDPGIPPPLPSGSFNERTALPEPPPPPVPSVQPAEAVMEVPSYHAISTEEERSPTTQTFPPIAHQMSEKEAPPPPGQHRQPPQQDVRLPAPFPHPHQLSAYTALEPRFPTLQDRRHRISLLSHVWLFIAGLYTRAGLFDDAHGAIQEASKLVAAFEAESSREDPSERGFSTRGWGGGKSVEELWGDIWAEYGHLSRARSSPHEGMRQYEKALSHFPDHPAATVGLCEILLDIYAQTIPPEPVDPASLMPSSDPDSASQGTTTAPTTTSVADQPMNTSETLPAEKKPEGVTASRHKSASPEELNRLSARDRAYGLLSSLTKLGSGWDYSEAWFALAKAYEEGGQIEKAKEVLWWCVELEDTRPIRPWSAVGLGAGLL